MEGVEIPRKLLSLDSCLLCTTTERRLHDLNQQNAIQKKYKETLQEYLNIVTYFICSV